LIVESHEFFSPNGRVSGVFEAESITVNGLEYTKFSSIANLTTAFRQSEDFKTVKVIVFEVIDDIHDNDYDAEALTIISDLLGGRGTVTTSPSGNWLSISLATERLPRIIRDVSLAVMRVWYKAVAM
jgi:hypothetical protein